MSRRRGPMLRFKLSQNESVNYDSREFVMPISTRSIAGSAALGKKPINIADAYDIPAGAQYGFDRRFDEKIGYRTKSMLTVPLISQRDEVIGVIQLINKKKDPEKKLFTQGRRRGAGRRRSTSAARSSSAWSPRRQAHRSRTRCSTTRSGSSSRAS